jgi:DNA-binding ferritin-like protein
MNVLLEKLLTAVKVAHMWHWKVKRFSHHMAFGELYEGLQSLTDELAEMYMGKYGTDGHIELSEPNGFSEQDPLLFIQDLDDVVDDLRRVIPQDTPIQAKMDDIQELISTTRYKLENLE